MHANLFARSSPISSGRTYVPPAFCALSPERCRWHGRHTVRCNAQPGLDRDAALRRNLPAAPPARMPPPPPPPPPPPSQEIKSDINISRRGLAAVLFGGAAAWYFLINRTVPLAGVDKDRNVALLRTKGGNVVAATTDEQGRVFMFDKIGNIYYDTEDPRLGLYIVDRQGGMFNKFVDADGNVQTVEVGNINEMISIKVDEVGGENLKELQRSFQQARNGRVTGFFQPPDPSRPSDYINEEEPWRRGADGKFKPPAMLEDWEISLEPKLFKSAVPEQETAEELVKSLKREGS